MIGKIILLILISLVLSLGLTPLVKRLAFYIKAVDCPNERKVHEGIMPRLGGLAIFLSFALVSLVFAQRNSAFYGLLLADLIIVLTGVLDDTRGLSPKMKMLGQLLAALVLVEYGFIIGAINIPVFSSYLWLSRASVIFTVLWLMGITNAVNLIDGLDGLAAGTVSIALVAILLGALSIGAYEAVFLGAIFLGAILGFLPYNFYPASIFMGDTGSMLLGFNVAAFAIMGMTKSVTLISLIIPVLFLGVPILDTLWAILRRASNGAHIFQADKKHLHHRLLNMGHSHRNTVLLIYGFSAYLGVSALLMQDFPLAASLILLVGVLAFLIYLFTRMQAPGLAGSVGNDKDRDKDKDKDKDRKRDKDKESEGHCES